MTSNRPLEDWGKLIGDVPSATAILDRFLHHAEMLTITGRSYRLKDQPQGRREQENRRAIKKPRNEDRRGLPGDPRMRYKINGLTGWV